MTPLNVRELVDRYLRHVRQSGTIAPDTITHRERTLAEFVRTFGDVPVEDLRSFHLVDWIADHPGWKAPATRQLRAAEVKAAFAWAYDQDRIEKHPFRRVRYQSSPRRPELPDDVLARLIDGTDWCFGNLLRFLRLTGCRVGELCGARWADMDLDRGLWTIHRHKGWRATRKPKIVVLVKEAIELLRAIAFTWANTDHAEAGVMPAERMPAPTDHVFFNRRGTPWSTSVARQRMSALCRRLGVKGYCLHCTRHTCASAAIRAGVPIKFVSLMLGHRSPAVTIQFYDHCTTERDLDAVRAAAEAARPGFEMRNGRDGGGNCRP